MDETSDGEGQRPSRAPEVQGYRDLQRVGSGGFSTVYRAYEPDFDRTVAIKILSLAVSDPAAQRRFKRECQLMGRLGSHPHVLTVFASGVLDDDRPFLVMEYLDGGTSADQAPMAQDEVLRTGILVGSALSSVHAAGVLHRDVKPQNILLSRYGQPVLADFGVSALVQQGGAISTPMALSPLYAAPEAFHGQPESASDQYSLAAALYALLTGRAPFEGEAEQPMTKIMLRVLEDEPTAPPADVAAPALWEVLQRALDKDPSARYPSVVHLVAALQEAQRTLGYGVTAAVDSAQPGRRNELGVSARVPTRPPLGGAATPAPRPAEDQGARRAPPQPEGLDHETRPAGWPDPPKDVGPAEAPSVVEEPAPDHDGPHWVTTGLRPSIASDPGVKGTPATVLPEVSGALGKDRDPTSTSVEEVGEEPNRKRSPLLPVLVLVLAGLVLALVVVVMLAGEDGTTSTTSTTSTTVDPPAVGPKVTDLEIDPKMGEDFTLSWEGEPAIRYRVFSYVDDPSLVGQPTLVKTPTATDYRVAVDRNQGTCFYVVLEAEVQMLIEAGEDEIEAMNDLADSRAGVCVNGATEATIRGG